MSIEQRVGRDTEAAQGLSGHVNDFLKPWLGGDIDWEPTVSDLGEAIRNDKELGLRILNPNMSDVDEKAYELWRQAARANKQPLRRLGWMAKVPRPTYGDALESTVVGGVENALVGRRLYEGDSDVDKDPWSKRSIRIRKSIGQGALIGLAVAGCGDFNKYVHGLQGDLVLMDELAQKARGVIHDMTHAGEAFMNPSRYPERPNNAWSNCYALPLPTDTKH